MTRTTEEEHDGHTIQPSERVDLHVAGFAGLARIAQVQRADPTPTLPFASPSLRVVSPIDPLLRHPFLEAAPWRLWFSSC